MPQDNRKSVVIILSGQETLFEKINEELVGFAEVIHCRDPESFAQQFSTLLESDEKRVLAVVAHPQFADMGKRIKDADDKVKFILVTADPSLTTLGQLNHIDLQVEIDAVSELREIVRKLSVTAWKNMLGEQSGQER